MNSYIITTTTVEMVKRVGWTAPEPVVTRRAVATLELAHASVFRSVTSVPGYGAGIGFPTDAAIASAIPDAGGTITLPDGMTVTVTPTLSWGGVPIGMARWLREERGWTIPRAMSDEDAIDAFNAEEGA